MKVVRYNQHGARPCTHENNSNKHDVSTYLQYFWNKPGEYECLKRCELIIHISPCVTRQHRAEICNRIRVVFNVETQLTK